MKLTTILLLLGVFLSGCTPTRPDYSLYERHFPKSILVLPPLNETASIEATNQFMHTITTPLAEQGYYVFPVAVIDRILRENGVVSPVEMRQLSLKKLKEIFGADALLDITIEDWGTQYLVIASTTTVTVSYRLVDLETGALLWSGKRSLSDNGNRGGGLSNQLIGALVHAVSNTLSQPESDLARRTNWEMLRNRHTGLLPGPRLGQRQ